MPNGNRYILILGRNAQEAATYAKRADLPNFTYRAVSSASSIRGIQVADVHVLSGFHSRIDKHAILKELRYGRDIQYFDVEMPEPPPVDQGDGMGEQLDLISLYLETAPKRHKSVDPEVEIVGGRVAVLEAMADEVDEVAQIEAPQPAAESLAHVGPVADTAAEQAEEPKPRKRRTRCKVCGHLTAAAYEVDMEGHNLAVHTGEDFFS